VCKTDSKCVSVCVCMSACICIFVCVCLCARLFVCKRMCVCMYVRACVRVCISCTWTYVWSPQGTCRHFATAHGWTTLTKRTQRKLRTIWQVRSLSNPTTQMLCIWYVCMYVACLVCMYVCCLSGIQACSLAVCVYAYIHVCVCVYAYIHDAYIHIYVSLYRYVQVPSIVALKQYVDIHTYNM
jgi:hypothetical protein